MISAWVFWLIMMVMVYSMYGWFAPIPCILIMFICLWYKWKVEKKKYAEQQKSAKDREVELIINLQNKHAYAITKAMNNNVRWKKYYDKELQKFIDSGATDEEIEDFRKYNQFAVAIRNNEDTIKKHKVEFDKLQEEIEELRAK